MSQTIEQTRYSGSTEPIRTYNIKDTASHKAPPYYKHHCCLLHTHGYENCGALGFLLVVGSVSPLDLINLRQSKEDISWSSIPSFIFARFLVVHNNREKSHKGTFTISWRVRLDAQ